MRHAPPYLPWNSLGQSVTFKSHEFRTDSRHSSDWFIVDDNPEDYRHYTFVNPSSADQLLLPRDWWEETERIEIL